MPPKECPTIAGFLSSASITSWYRAAPASRGVGGLARSCRGQRAGRSDRPDGRLLRLAPGEIVALRWRDVDFAKRALRVETSVVFGTVDPTKGGRGSAVPMVREVAEALARLGQRGYLVDRDDPVFSGEGDWLDGSAVRRRFVAACERVELRVLRFHDFEQLFLSVAEDD